MERKIKALFFDVDGTLVSFRTHRIPQSTVDALEQAKARGIKVYISTGRPVVLMTNLGQIEHLIDGYITTNGAHCFVGDDLVCKFPISPADVQKVLDDSDRQDYPVIVVGERQIAVHNRKPIVDELFVEGLGVNNLDFNLDVDDLQGEQILQLSPFCSAEQRRRFMTPSGIVPRAGGILPSPTSLPVRLTREMVFATWLIISGSTLPRRQLSGMEATTSPSSRHLAWALPWEMPARRSRRLPTM